MVLAGDGAPVGQAELGSAYSFPLRLQVHLKRFDSGDHIVGGRDEMMFMSQSISNTPAPSTGMTSTTWSTR